MKSSPPFFISLFASLVCSSIYLTVFNGNLLLILLLEVLPALDFVYITFVFSSFFPIVTSSIVGSSLSSPSSSSSLSSSIATLTNLFF